MRKILLITALACALFMGCSDQFYEMQKSPCAKLLEKNKKVYRG